MSQKTEKISKTSEQRKAEYRDLLDRAEILQENEEIGLETTKALDDILRKANLLFKNSNIKERIKHTDEVLLDAKVLATASDVLLNVTEAVDCTLDTYEPLELARKIRTQLLNNEDDTEINWTEITKISETILKFPPNFSFLYGELSATTTNTQQKPAKIRKARTQTKIDRAAKKEPEKITQVSKEEDSVDDTVKFLQWVLNKEYIENGEQKLNYFQFTIDPSSYTATIENMFHLSFLVRDGRARVDIDENGILEITPVSSHETKRARKGGVHFKQNIISIDIEEWKELIEIFDIRKCFLTKWKSKWDSQKMST